MMQLDVATFARRLKDGETHFHRRQSPAAIVHGRDIMYDSVPQFVDDLHARHRPRRQRIEPAFEICIDCDALGSRTQIAAIAGRDQQTEILVVTLWR